MHSFYGISRGIYATIGLSLPKTAKGPVSWEQWRNELNSVYPIEPAKRSPPKSPIVSEDLSPKADASADDPLGVSDEGINTGPAIAFVDYTKILGGIGAGLIESTVKGLYHAGAAVVRPSERLQGEDNLEYVDIENQEAPEIGLAGFSDLASAMYEQAKLSSENYRKAIDNGEYFEAGKEASHDPLMHMTGLGDLAVLGAMGKLGRAIPNKLDNLSAPGPVNFMADSDRFYLNASKRHDIDPDGYFDVVAHGSPNKIQVETINGQVLLDHRAVARLIQQQPGYNGQNVRLFSCSTGACDTGFAQNLANKLNVEIHAPTDLLWAYPNGKTLVAPKGVNGQPDLNSIGEFKVFLPNKGW